MRLMAFCKRLIFQEIEVDSMSITATSIRFVTFFDFSIFRSQRCLVSPDQWFFFYPSKKS